MLPYEQELAYWLIVALIFSPLTGCLGVLLGLYAMVDFSVIEGLKAVLLGFLMVLFSPLITPMAIISMLIGEYMGGNGNETNSTYVLPPRLQGLS